ncbi:uncharacterized protein HD556DRAFT_1311497 [Suillus plorans]|uniref:Uncharacterized protein n=1 Tax=Suillus plorans TaxID=116603 RepID=A0A9P7DEJ6_9AGAM|nr:uncharacterized protein HD556DRAFT_1311497 [Suillus plorans]KAG1789322.1 hypothetical protein HD556DRAFT_1311497 [Suillus plorans]
MAPPIKYKTPAAKLQAERAKRRRYYKRRRGAILAKRRQERKDKNTRDNDNIHSLADDDNNHSDDDEPITLSDYIVMVKLAKDDFMEHIKSPQTFATNVLARYTKSIPDTYMVKTEIGYKVQNFFLFLGCIGFELKVTIGHQEHSGKILLEDKQVMGSLEKSTFEGGIRKTPIC